jgi:hypothetical protein
MQPMTRISFALAIVVVLLGGALTGCSSRTEPARSAVPTFASEPGVTWLAVLGSAADPNELDTPREDLVQALGAGSAPSVLVSPGGCFTGLPQRYGPLYVMAVVDATRSSLVERLVSGSADAEWIGAVTSTCLD